MNDPDLQNSDPSNSDAFTDDALTDRLDRLWDTARRKPSVVSAHPLQPNLIGRQVGAYTINRLIGSGSFGIIFRAHDAQLDRMVALKIPRPEVLCDRARMSRFEVEAVASARLDHPGIVPIYEANLDGDPPYIASAYCPGPDLAQWLEEHGRAQSIDAAIHLVVQIADAVQHAHEHGVIHRDLKPSNVMLVAQSIDCESELSAFWPRLTDFGLARLSETELLQTNSSLVIGTPMYMAPEQAECRLHQIGPATDVFAIGSILYELLIGVPPFDADNYSSLLIRLRDDPPASMTAQRPDVSSAIDQVCQKCLRQSPEDRYQTAGELATELRRCLAGVPVQAKPLHLGQRLIRWSRRPARMSDLCTSFMVISLFRIAFAFVGLIALNLVESTSLTWSENQSTILAHLLFTIPLDAGLVYMAIRSQKHKLHQSTYLLVLGSVWLIGWLSLMVAFNFTHAPPWYDRMPAAKLLVFTLVGMLFLFQTVCWYLADWNRVSANTKRSLQVKYKRAALAAPCLLMGLSVGYGSAGPRQADLALPPASHYFDGVDDHVQIGSASFVTGDQFTLESWVNYTGTHNGTIVNYSPVVVMAIHANNLWRLRTVIEFKDGSMLLIDGVNMLTQDQWTHVAVTYDGTRLQMFANGDQVDVETSLLPPNGSGFDAPMPEPLTLRQNYGAPPVHIGVTNPLRSPLDNPSAFRGKIGEVRVSNNVRYRQSFYPPSELVIDASTKFLLRFDDTNTNLVSDLTGTFHCDVNR